MRATVALGMVAALWASPAAAAERVCEVLDAATVRLCGGERVRLAGIDAPGAMGGCPEERRQAMQATLELRRLLAGGEVELLRRGRDDSGRTLARLRVGSRDVGEAMIASGTVRRWTGRRTAWCPP